MAQARALADRVMPGEGLAWEVLRVAAGSILVALCAQIALPLPWTPVPVTLQTFGVMFVAVALGSRRGALAMALYLLEGAMGLPVFQPLGAPGIARLAGPTAGYLWAYPAAAFVSGWLAERIQGRSELRLIGALAAGQSLIFLSGSVWLVALMHYGFAQALQAGALPFLPGEAIKIALVVGATAGLDRATIRPE